ncbi:adenylosuccinate synthetase [Roseomonas sp. USHLN139]|uniref:adenylosuccinate synthetase n=1 Tax=Roseomonas sp. USHLN139 TaxID=3081298 RepID=UPI003B01D7FB
MSTAEAVIGAGYGDEGKGLLTDALAARAIAAGETVVVLRCNGGAQAGHTVVTPEGLRHVFSHFGAGTLAGAASWLGPDFVANPALFVPELAALRRLGAAPRLLADPRAAVTTPCDMLVNQALEQARGAARHGSVGVGFGETIERGLFPEFRLSIGDLAEGRDGLRARLETIRRDWMPRRLAALGLAPDATLMALLQDDALIEAFCDDALAMLGALTLCPAAALPSGTRIFEGAQGLLLDAERGAFPHVTRSRTGLAGLLPVLRAAGITRLRVTYATRAYVTRHGAGPLAHALDGPPAPGVVDRTNRPHPFQGSLRFAPLDLDILRDAIRADLGDAPDWLTVEPGLAVTCLDQMDATIGVFVGGSESRLVREALPPAVAAHCGLKLRAVASGERRSRVQFHAAAALAA